MKWYVCLVLACWTVEAVNRSVEVPEEEDAAWKTFAENLGSDGQESTEYFAGFQNEGEETTMRAASDEMPAEDVNIFLKSYLDILNPNKMELILRENGNNISAICSEKLMSYLKGLKEAKSWAMKVLDASGSYSFTFLFGNDYWLGSQTACLDFLHPRNANDSPPFPVAYYAAKYQVTLNLSSLRPMRQITVGVCLPAECPKKDLRLLLEASAAPVATLKTVRAVPDDGYNFFLEPIGITLLVITIGGMILVIVGTWYENRKERKQREGFDQGQRNKEIGQNKTPIKISTVEKLRFYVNHHVEGFLLNIILFKMRILGMILVIVGTWYENRKERKQRDGFDQGQRNKEIGQNKTPIKISTVEKLRFYVNHHVEGGHKGVSNLGLAASTNSINSSTSSASVSSFDSTESKIGIGVQILLCFSFKRNFEKICNSKTTDSLACVHGLRVFSLLWVIAGHTCMITMPFVDNKNFRMIVERDFLFQSISNGAFSVDTFFFISGLLISYVFYKSEMEKNTGKEDTAKTHARNSLLKFIGGVTYRLIRLSPPYLVVLILTYLTGRWFYFNSVFDPPVGDHVTCPQYWWRNILYINTLFPVDQMCMIWSWYLADDTQFYILGLMLLLISSRYSKSAAALTGIFLVTSWATTAIITLYTQHKPSIEEPLGLFDQLYDKPWTRLGPYIVGMAVGVYLAKVNCKATYHKGVVTFLWIISMLTTFVLVHGLYGELDQVESAAYVALSHTAWALAISWIVIACVTGYGGPVNAILSSKIFAPLSRLSYCAYLIHPLIMLSAMAHMDGPIHLQRDTMIIAIFGYFLVSYLASIVLTIVFEAPAVALLNKFHPLKKKMK